MGDLMPGIPSVPGDETTWAAAVDQFETLKKGDMPLSLTNWDDLDLVPSIAAGAGIEIAGATYRFTVESLISDEAGLVAGTVYVVIKTADPTANEATAYFTNVAPEWRDDLHGWYDTTGANRYTGHVMDWDGAAAYTNKRYLPVKPRGLDAEGDASISGSLTWNFTGIYGSWDTSGWEGGTYIPPNGLYMLASSVRVFIQIYDGGSWQGYTGDGATISQAGLFVSDGTNYRLYAPSGAVISYRKLG